MLSKVLRMHAWCFSDVACDDNRMTIEPQQPLDQISQPAPPHLPLPANFNPRHAASVRAIGLLLMIGAVFGMLGSLFQIQKNSSIGAIGLVLGVVGLVLGAGLARLESWAVIPTRIILLLNLCSFPGGTIMSVILLCFLLHPDTKLVVTERHKALCAQAPVKASVWAVWVLLGIILFVVGMTIAGK